MKKYLLLLIIPLLLFGCGKKDDVNIKNNFIKNMTKKDSYLVKGTMTIISNEDSFNYNVIAGRNKDYYRVNLTNTINNHDQVILKNAEGVYVVTPSLNKSFKFQSNWPLNGSQGYLLDSLANDVSGDNESDFEVNDNGFIITTNVNYPNNPSLTKEKIYLDENEEIKKVEVIDLEGNVKITINFTSIDFKPTFDEDYFKLESLIDEDCCSEEETSKNIDEIIYPLYLPANTYLSSKDVINTDDGNRIILTFTGDSPFTLVEEVSNVSNEFEIIPVYGEPLMLSETCGALSSNALYWTSNNIDYYLSSDSLSGNELLSIAESVSSGALTVSKEK